MTCIDCELFSISCEGRYGKTLNVETICKEFDSENLKSDNVNHPSHYTSGKIECINYIQDKLTPEEFRGYNKGNVIKYVTRERHKNGDGDLKKAKWYSDKLIDVLEGSGEK